MVLLCHTPAASDRWHKLLKGQTDGNLLNVLHELVVLRGKRGHVVWGRLLDGLKATHRQVTHACCHTHDLRNIEEPKALAMVPKEPHWFNGQSLSVPMVFPGHERTNDDRGYLRPEDVIGRELPLAAFHLR